MRIEPEEIAAIIAATIARTTSDTKEVAALRERVLKLEHKLNELYDMLTDFRVNQVMGAQQGVDTSIPEWHEDSVRIMGGESE